jgi:hypothetical protein
VKRSSLSVMVFDKARLEEAKARNQKLKMTTF